SEIVCTGRGPCPKTVPAQLIQLRDALALARRQRPERNLDLVLLTVGANDIHFSELVSNVILDQSAERVVFTRAGLIATVEQAESALTSGLAENFARLRAALKTLLPGGDLSRVVYVSYSNPALTPDGAPCPGSRAGFDIHPAFALNAELVRQAVAFVDGRFLPRLKALALCQGGTLCHEGDRMTFVDAHQRVMSEHGVCARAESDPEFDRECFAADG